MKPQLGVALLLAFLVACGTQQSGAPPVTDPIEVELDIYSGMPNPTWVLSATDSTELRRRIDALPTTKAAAPAENLGYRGFLVRLAEGAEPARVRQVVRLADKSVRDAGDRGLERWLLGTGRGKVPADVIAVVEKELG